MDTRQATVDPGGRAHHLLGALEVTDTDAAQRSALARLLDHLPLQQRALVWLDAYEDHYRGQLLRTLSRHQPEQPDAPPRAQVVCCIDPRSEGLRRHLEALGNYQTLGFAGFFAVAMRYRDLAGGAARAQCPGPITPRHTVTERPTPGRQRAAERSLAGRRVLAAIEHSLHTAKDDLLAPFVLAESAGWLAGPLAAAKTFAPRAAGATRAWGARRITPDPPTEISITDVLTPEERAATAETILTLMGLTRGFARLVVFCGHRAHTDNNPYQAALDCGACGGHPGGPNARTAAALLNDPLSAKIT
ncbi:putative inorganic carbon transporter subunit DabA [Pseudonocardia autotrophica]|uniref:putative inorganic carbon transporter subunit DabA n=1 Tax=Pseudonocardia autotrophica TaxID=2074 RepID=UPI002F94C12B